MRMLQNNEYSEFNNEKLGHSFNILMCHKITKLLAPPEVAGLNVESVESEGTMFWFLVENHPVSFDTQTYQNLSEKKLDL